MKRANHISEGLSFPDFTARVPTITYLCPEGHRINLRYDLGEDLGTGFNLPGDETYVDEPFIYCQQEKQYYPLSDCTAVYPRSKRRADHKLKGKGLSAEMDLAIIKNRVIRLLVIGGLTHAEIAERVGLPRVRVTQIVGEIPYFSTITSSGRVVSTQDSGTREQ